MDRPEHRDREHCDQRFGKASDDIVKRKEAEEALRGAKEELDRHSRDLERQVGERTREIGSILRYTPAVVYIKDREGRDTFVNSRYEQLFGVRTEEIRGKTDHDIFPEEFAGRFQANDRKVLKDRSPCRIEERVPQEDGPHVYLSTKFPLDNEEGAVAAGCGISIDITEIKKARDQMKRLSDSIIASQEKERAAVSRELHDELGQVLTALRLDSAWLRERFRESDAGVSLRTQEMCDLIDKAIDDVRGMATRLRPGVLDDLGLVDAIDWYIDDFEKRTKVSDRVATAAYRIAQEALTNVARHSKASHVDVSRRAEGEILTLSVEDDGRGFDLRELPESAGLEVAGMRERAERIGGVLEIMSRPGEGTRVRLKVPVAGAEEVLH